VTGGERGDLTITSRVRASRSKCPGKAITKGHGLPETESMKEKNNGREVLLSFPWSFLFLDRARREVVRSRGRVRRAKGTKRLGRLFLGENVYQKREQRRERAGPPYILLVMASLLDEGVKKDTNGLNGWTLRGEKKEGGEGSTEFWERRFGCRETKSRKDRLSCAIWT